MPGGAKTTPNDLSKYVYDPFLVYPGNIHPPHRPTDNDWVNQLAYSMKKGGWQGRPLLAYRLFKEKKGPIVWQAITGSHRIAAARLAKLNHVPVVEIEKEIVHDLSDYTSEEMEEVLLGNVPESIYRLAVENPMNNKLKMLLAQEDSSVTQELMSAKNHINHAIGNLKHAARNTENKTLKSAINVLRERLLDVDK